MNYTIWVVSPYSHSQCFLEAAQSLQSAFIELGHACELVTTPPISRENVVIMGAHLLHASDIFHLKDPVIWQLEQMPGDDDGREESPLTATYLEILRRAKIWDYSRVNIENLGKLGIDADLLEVGYMPILTRIENVPEPDIDVLFVGSLNDRRHAVLRELSDAGVKVAHAFDCYGVKRDALIARSRVVLNCHYYTAKIFEIVRCSYLMANRKCVVSEWGSDKKLEMPYVQGVAFATYNDLVHTCLQLVGNEQEREKIAQRGYEIFSKNSQVEYLKAAL